MFINNVDLDGDGRHDIDQFLSVEREFSFGIEDIGVQMNYHVYAVLYILAGEQIFPVAEVGGTALSMAATLGLAG